ncbi:MAG: peptidase M16, partial [Desulfuromonas sp.]
DPHIVRTLQVYRDAAEWAATGNFDQTDIKEAILSCFADIDRPNSPAGRAYREFNCLEQGLTRELRQRFREGLLTVDRTKLMELAQRFLINGWDESAVAVLGGEELLERENKQLTPALKVERI